MDINERFYDDSAFLPIGSLMPAPGTTGGLLGRLKLITADPASQSAGIAEWLRDHTPSAGFVRARSVARWSGVNSQISFRNARSRSRANSCRR